MPSPAFRPAAPLALVTLLSMPIMLIMVGLVLGGCGGDPPPAGVQRVSLPPGTGPVHHCAVQTLDGRSTTIGAYFEGKPMIVEVWSTTCAPCKRQRAIFKKLGSQLTDNVTLVGVSVDPTADVASAYLRSSPTPGMVELFATPEFRSLIKPHLKKPVMTIPQILYVSSNGDVLDIADSVQSEVWLTARAKSMQ